MDKLNQLPIPIESNFISIKGNSDIDYKAICVFAALGFFLDDDSYYLNKKYQGNHSYNWSYTPEIFDLEEAVDEFAKIFEGVIQEQVMNKKVILPLSGGLDSRTQLVALKRINADVSSYSYYFDGGYREDLIAKDLAELSDIEFKSFVVENGSLWSKLDDLIEINKCYTDFTLPRQIIHLEESSKLGEIFSLGHWGDVIFDSDRTIHDYSSIYEYLSSKLIKPGGIKLGKELWEIFDLNDDFEEYLKSRILQLWDSINENDLEAKFRIFKSKYWAPRWTSVNLSVFSKYKPITLPYYDKRLIDLSFKISNELLRGRKIQIEYIKKYGTELANITWQSQRPFHLNNFYLNKFPFNSFYRVSNKLNRMYQGFFKGTYIQRNWELQFLGENNISSLKKRVLNSQNKLITGEILLKYIDKFECLPNRENAHSLSILLTISQKRLNN